MNLLPDLLAFAVFLLCWLGYNRFALTLSRGQRGLHHAVFLHRRRWMHSVLRRDNRILDSTLIGNLMNSVSFFASTTIFILAGLVAVLGASDRAQAMLSDLPWVAATPKGVWQGKVLVLITIFIYAFFKFTWALRQFNYTCILVGGLPTPEEAQAGQEAAADRAADLLSLAAANFTQGIRGYYFGLATLTWFIHPALFAAVSLWVVWVLYRREYRSKTLEILAGGQAPGEGETGGD